MLDQGFFLIPLLLLVALGSLVRRWRASSGVERLQYPWLMTAIGFVIVILVITQLVPESVILDVSLVFIALNAIPAAIGVAILRYRLYDIDKLISRTVSYAVVAAVLVAVYAGSILALGSLVGRGNPLAVAGATLASAALFTPGAAPGAGLHRPTLRSGEIRRGPGSGRRSPRGCVKSVDLDGLVGDVTSVVRRTLHPETVSLWVRRGADGLYPNDFCRRGGGPAPGTRPLAGAITGMAAEGTIMIRRWLGVVIALVSVAVIVYGQTQNQQSDGWLVDVNGAAGDRLSQRRRRLSGLAAPRESGGLDPRRFRPHLRTRRDGRGRCCGRRALGGMERMARDLAVGGLTGAASRIPSALLPRWQTALRPLSVGAAGDTDRAGAGHLRKRLRAVGDGGHGTRPDHHLPFPISAPRAVTLLRAGRSGRHGAGAGGGGRGTVRGGPAVPPVCGD